MTSIQGSKITVQSSSSVSAISSKNSDIISKINFDRFIHLLKNSDSQITTKTILSEVKGDFSKDFTKFKLSKTSFTDFVAYFTKHIEKKDFFRAFHLFVSSHYDTEDKNRVFQALPVTVKTEKGECDEVAMLAHYLAKLLGMKGKVIAEITDPNQKTKSADGHVEFFYHDKTKNILIILDQDNLIEIDLAKHKLEHWSDWRNVLHESPSRKDVICGKELDPDIATTGNVSEMEFVRIDGNCLYYRPTHNQKQK